MRSAIAAVGTIARYTALEALRTHYAWLVLFLLAAGFAVAAFTGELAITETTQTQAAVSATLLRFAAVLLVILFVTTSVSRDFSDKSIELMLSLPLPRAGYYFGKLAGYALIALLTALPLASLMIFFAPGAAALLWGVSLMLELSLVAGFSLLFALAFGQVAAASAATLLVYLLSRSIAAMQLMAHGPLANPHQTSQQVLTATVDTLAYLLPDLDRFTQSEWLMYQGGSLQALAPLLTQSLVYLLLLSGIALFDLYRKNF